MQQPTFLTCNFLEKMLAKNIIGKKENYMTVPAAIRELNKIELIRQADGIYRLDHAVTATQKDILQAFNLTAADVKKEAVELGTILRTLTA